MKRQLLVLFAISSLFGSCTETECSRFKVGSFYIKGDDTYADNYSVRTDSTEIIFNDSLGFRDEFKIAWIDECNYYMVFQRTNNPGLIKITSSDTIFIKFLETSDQSYTYRGKVNGHEFETEAVIM